MKIQKTFAFPLLAPLLLVFLFSACGKEEEAAQEAPEQGTSTAPEEVATQLPAAVPVQAEVDSSLAGHEQMAKNFLKQLVEIDTTHSTGSATVAAQAMADHLIAAGFPAEDVQVIEPEPTKGNLVARYRGKDKGNKPLLLLAHIDVVEANPDDWELPPFEFIEEDGYYHGRGTTDDKDEAAIHVANLIRLKQEGYEPNRDIIMALTADEEGGPHNGVDWLLKNRRDLVEAAYVINEGGGGNIKDGRYVSNAVQASEKVYQSYHIEFTNSGGHSSLPLKDNAIYRLADALAKIRDYDFPVKLNEVTRMFFERSAELESGPLQSAMRGVLQSPPDPAAIAYLEKTPYFNSRMRTTCVATMVDAGHRENALPQRAKATVNCRILPGEPVDEVENTLNYVIGDEQVSITPTRVARTSDPSPLTAELMQVFDSVTESIFPGVPVIPTMSAGATDGSYFRNAGIPVYGISGLFNDIDDIRAHGLNERIEIKTFYEGQEFLYQLTKALTQ